MHQQEGLGDVVNVSFRFKSTCKDYRHALVFLWLAAAPLSECSTIVLCLTGAHPFFCVSHILLLLLLVLQFS